MTGEDRKGGRPGFSVWNRAKRRRKSVSLWEREGGGGRANDPPVLSTRHLVSSVGRVPVCRAEGCGFKPDQHAGSLSN